MKRVIYCLLAVAGLFGCASRNPGSREQFYAYKDSMAYARLDTSAWHCNRHTQLRLSSRLKEISLSSPDSSGNQHVERIVYATEEWGIADSTEVLSASATVTEKQVAHTSIAAEKETVKRKPNRCITCLIILFLLSLIYFFWKRCRD